MLKLILINYILSLICLLIFLKGYFPIKTQQYRNVAVPKAIGSVDLNVSSKVYKARIDRLVFIIIDALRTDFVHSMPYTYAHNECVMDVKVEAPTVTLPRIKALTTGEVPQYIDIVLNLGAATRCEDSFLHRARKEGKRMLFYGDETWLKIYPELFVRQEGTNSFFVNDFYEVDDNVTRHLDAELARNDWDIMFLHYLGLDHIGHVLGPYSKLVPTKLHEMDAIVKKIHHASLESNQTTLILVTGDHGMKDSGGHGGTTHPETHVPLITFGIPCSVGNISQTDIATTLSLLFGIEIASNSIGKLIPSYFQQIDHLEYLYLLYYNLLVLKRDAGVCDGEFARAERLHEQILRDFNESVAFEIRNIYMQCLSRISDDLIHKSIEQNVELLIFAFICTLITLINLNSLKYSIALLIAFVAFNNFVFYINIVACLILAKQLLQINYSYKKLDCLHIPIIIHAILLQSSSYVEEEHQIFYYFLASSTLLLFYDAIRINRNLASSFNVLLVLIILRFVRMINSTGDQWASYPDLADWLLIEQNFIYLLIFYAISFALTYYTTTKLMQLNSWSKLLMLIAFLLTFFYKMFFIRSILLPRSIWCIAAAMLFVQKRNLLFVDRLIMAWLTLIALLLQPYNLILIPFCIVASMTYKQVNKSRGDAMTLLHLYLGYACFFCQGHSNSISSIDLAPAYIGLTRYVPSLVLLFTLSHTYAFPILSTLLLLKHAEKRSHSRILYRKIAIRLFLLVVIYILSILQRGHLFIWSVFAPKLIIESVHTFILLFESFLILLINAT